jgi:hypothetical protein
MGTTLSLICCRECDKDIDIKLGRLHIQWDDDLTEPPQKVLVKHGTVTKAYKRGLAIGKEYIYLQD